MTSTVAHFPTPTASTLADRHARNKAEAADISREAVHAVQALMESLIAACAQAAAMDGVPPGVREITARIGPDIANQAQTIAMIMARVK